MSRLPIPRPGLVVHLDSIRLSEYDDDGFLGFQIDADGDTVDGAPELEAQVTPFEALHVYGFLSRPLDPTTDGGGQVTGGSYGLTFWEGARGYSVALHDSRVVPALARTQKGESVQYGAANNFIRCHADGRISQMCTTDGTENGDMVACETGPDGFAWRAPWGTLTHNKYGFHYRHSSGARLDLGAISGLPAPLDQLGAYATLEAPIISLKGAAVKLGVGTFEPAAKALTLLAGLAPVASAHTADANAMTLLATALTAIQAALAATVPPVGAGTAAPIAAAVAALTAASTANGGAATGITGLTVTMPAVAVTVA